MQNFFNPPIAPGPRFPAGGGGRGFRRQMPTRRQGPAMAVDRFVRGFRQEMQRKKQNARQEAMADLNLLQQGIPVDQDKLAKKLRKAGIDLDYEGPTPMEQMEQQQAQQAQAQPVSAPVPQHLPGQGPGGGGVMGALKRKLSPPDIPKSAGVYKMLDDLKKRGQMNAQTQQTEGQLKQMTQSALLTLMRDGVGTPQGQMAYQQLERVNPQFMTDLGNNKRALEAVPGLRKMIEETNSARAEAEKRQGKFQIAKTLAGKHPELTEKFLKWSDGGAFPDMPEKDGTKDALSFALNVAGKLGPQGMARAGALMEAYQSDPMDALAIAEEIAKESASKAEAEKRLRETRQSALNHLNRQLKEGSLKNQELTRQKLEATVKYLEDITQGGAQDSLANVAAQ